MPSVLSDEIKEVFEQGVALLLDMIENTTEEDVAASALNAIGAIARAYGCAIVPDEILERLVEVTLAVVQAEADNKPYVLFATSLSLSASLPLCLSFLVLPALICCLVVLVDSEHDENCEHDEEEEGEEGEEEVRVCVCCLHYLLSYMSPQPPTTPPLTF